MLDKKSLETRWGKVPARPHRVSPFTAFQLIQGRALLNLALPYWAIPVKLWKWVLQICFPPQAETILNEKPHAIEKVRARQSLLRGGRGIDLLFLAYYLP